MKNRIFGITAFVAVVVLGLMFTACPADETDRVCDFSNVSSAPVNVTCAGSTPNSFTLPPLNNLATTPVPVTVTRAGKDIEVTLIEVNGITGTLADIIAGGTALSDVISVTGSPAAGSVIFGNPK